MGYPRPPWPKATPNTRKIPGKVWNDVLRTVEGLESFGRAQGYHVPGMPADEPYPHTYIRLVELDENMGPEESSEFRDRTGTVLYWDHDYYMWKRTDPAHQIEIVTDPWLHHVLHTGQRLLVYYHPQSGKHLPINPPQVRIVRTCTDEYGDYPAQNACPNCYPICHVKSSYATGSFSVTPTHAVMSSISRLTPDPPHGGQAEVSPYDPTGWVFNLAGGGDDEFYIPVGTHVWAFFLNGQWWTYWAGTATCEVSSSSSSSAISASTSSSSSTSLSSQSTASTSSEGTSSIEEGVLVYGPTASRVEDYIRLPIKRLKIVGHQLTEEDAGFDDVYVCCFEGEHSSSSTSSTSSVSTS